MNHDGRLAKLAESWLPGQMSLRRPCFLDGVMMQQSHIGTEHRWALHDHVRGSGMLID